MRCHQDEVEDLGQSEDRVPNRDRGEAQAPADDQCVDGNDELDAGESLWEGLSF